MLVLTAVLFLLFQLSAASEQNEAYWYYDLISLEVENHTPDVTVIDLYEKRVSRGVFVFSGTINIKQNLTDDMRASLTTYYSLTGQYYTKAPFFITDCKLTECVNIYIPLIIDDLRQCSNDIPESSGNFKPPLTPRLIKFNDCFISNDKLPTRIKTGFYKIILQFKTQIKSTIVYTVQVFDK